MSQKTVQKSEDVAPADMGEFNVTDELYEISEATNKDGTVDVKIYDFEKADDDSVTVHFYTPTMDKQSETMDWPRKDSPDYKFVRLCRATVGGLSGAEWLKTDGAKIKAHPDNWEIQAELSKSAKMKNSFFNTTARDIINYTVKSLFSLWIISLATIFVGVPIAVVVSIAVGVMLPEAVAGLWILSFLAILITVMFLPE